MKNKLKIIKAIMFLLFILGGSGLCLSGDKAQASDWYSPDWGYRKAITIDNTSNTSALTDYQVLVTLQGTNSSADNYVDFDKISENGADVRFTDSGKIMDIDFWIKEWDDVSESATIWVEVPSILASSTTTIYLYYGNDGLTGNNASSSFDDTMQKLEADDDTAGLWNFDEGTGSTLGDSSAYENDGVMNNFAVDGSGWVADSAFSNSGALNFDGVDDYVEISDNTSLDFGTSDLTIEFWAKAPEDTTGTIIDKLSQVSGQEYDIGFFVWAESVFMPGTTNLGIKFSFVGSDGNELDEQSGDEIPYENWYHITAVRANGILKFYRDSNLIEEGSDVIADIDNAESLLIGSGREGYFKGLVDELRISTRALTADEIKANYERRQYTETEPTNSLGAEETTPYNTSETVVAIDGGTVTNTADTAEITIPADALASDTDITIETKEETGNFQVQGVEPVDYIYNFGPEGTEFSSPVTLTFNYNDTEMTAEEENALDIYYYNTETSLWEAQGATLDTALNTLTLSVDHFSEYIVAMNVASSNISVLLSVIDNYSDNGKIGVEVNGERISSSTYFLKVHLKRAQKLIREGKDDKATIVLNKFIEKVDRFTPHLIDLNASEDIITRTDAIINLLE